MANRKVSLDSIARSTEPLYREIRAVLESARAGAYRAVNAAMVHAYWHVGRLIVEHEQRGRRRAAYGEQMLGELSRRLTAEFGRGFDATNLRHMRRFYCMFMIRDAVRREFAERAARRRQSAVPERENAVRSESANLGIRAAVRHSPATSTRRCSRRL